MIDLEALDWQITEKADKGIHVAPIVRELFAELKEARKERAAVVAWLRTVAPNAPTRRGADELAWCANAIERGEHRREEER
jgi:hypothetical protein